MHSAVLPKGIKNTECDTGGGKNPTIWKSQLAFIITNVSVLVAEMIQFKELRQHLVKSEKLEDVLTKISSGLLFSNSFSLLPKQRKLCKRCNMLIISTVSIFRLNLDFLYVDFKKDLHTALDTLLYTADRKNGGKISFVHLCSNWTESIDGTILHKFIQTRVPSCSVGLTPKMSTHNAFWIWPCEPKRASLCHLNLTSFLGGPRSASDQIVVRFDFDS